MSTTQGLNYVRVPLSLFRSCLAGHTIPEQGVFSLPYQVPQASSGGVPEASAGQEGKGHCQFQNKNARESSTHRRVSQ